MRSTSHPALRMSIDRAPGPAFAWFKPGHHRVARQPEVLRGVLPGRAVAAADMAADRAQPRVDPLHAEPQALFTPASVRRDRFEIDRMFANHGDSLLPGRPSFHEAFWAARLLVESQRRWDIG
jgi:hypothetical protein